jgi:solute:Na+ symporter, SSS family
MELHLLDFLSIGGYFLLMAVVAVFVRRSRSFSDFAVGRHSVPAVLIFASVASTIVGPGFSVGVSGKSWEQGFLFYFLAVAFALQVLLTGLLFAPRLARHRDCNTLGDVMRKRYGRTAHLLTGILSVGLCVGFTAIMGKVGGSVLHLITDWPQVVCIAIVTGTTGLLTFSGGLKATIATEGMQFAMIAIVIPVTLWLGISQSSLSVAELSAKAAEMTSVSYQSMAGWQMFGIVVSFLLGEALIPPYASRALAAKSVAASKIGFLLAGGFVVVWLGIVAAYGITAHGIIPSDTAPDDVFVTAGRAILPVGVFGILLATVVAVVMSSQVACLNAAASSLVRDIASVFARPGDATALVLAKGGTLVLAGLAIIFAQYAPSIIDGLLFLYAIWAPCMIIPLIGALFIESAKPLAGWLSIVGGGIGSWGWQLAGQPGELPSILVGLAASLLCFLLGQFFGANQVAAQS